MEHHPGFGRAWRQGIRTYTCLGTIIAKSKQMPGTTPPVSPDLSEKQKRSRLTEMILSVPSQAGWTRHPRAIVSKGCKFSYVLIAHQRLAGGEEQLPWPPKKKTAGLAAFFLRVASHLLRSSRRDGHGELCS